MCVYTYIYIDLNIYLHIYIYYIYTYTSVCDGNKRLLNMFENVCRIHRQINIHIQVCTYVYIYVNKNIYAKAAHYSEGKREPI